MITDFYVVFEVLIAVYNKITIFFHVTSCRLLDRYHENR